MINEKERLMAKKIPLKISDLFKVKTIQSIRWSPSGGHAVAVIKSTNIREQRNETALWLYRHADCAFRQITFGHADNEAAWLDEETILFTALERTPDEVEADKPFPKARFYTMSITGGEPHLAATIDGVVWDWALSPSRQKIALAFSPNPQDSKAVTEIRKKCDRPIVAHQARYKMDGIGYLPDGYPSIYVASLKKNGWSKPKPVVDHSEFWDASPKWLGENKLVFNRWHANRKDFFS